MEIKLKGLPAIILIIAFAMFFVWSNLRLQNDVEINDKLRENVQFQLLSKLSGGTESDSQAIQTALQKGDRKQAESLSRNVLKRKVEIDTLAMRGWGKKKIVRVRYRVLGPEGSKNKISYLEYRYLPITGWSYQYETSRVSWFMTAPWKGW